MAKVKAIDAATAMVSFVSRQPWLRYQAEPAKSAAIIIRMTTRAWVRS